MPEVLSDSTRMTYDSYHRMDFRSQERARVQRNVLDRFRDSIEEEANYIVAVNKDSWTPVWKFSNKETQEPDYYEYEFALEVEEG